MGGESEPERLGLGDRLSQTEPPDVNLDASMGDVVAARAEQQQAQGAQSQPTTAERRLMIEVSTMATPEELAALATGDIPPRFARLIQEASESGRGFDALAWARSAAAARTQSPPSGDPTNKSGGAVMGALGPDPADGGAPPNQPRPTGRAGVKSVGRVALPPPMRASEGGVVRHGGENTVDRILRRLHQPSNRGKHRPAS